MTRPLPPLSAPIPALEGKTFLLGLGAQKAGTSWLDRYLRGHPDTGLPLMKEVHFFDARFRPDLFGNFNARARSRLAAGEATHKPGHRGLEERRARVAAIDDDRAYLSIFEAAVGAARLTGEITPSYAGLSAAALRQIRAFLESAGLRVRVIFLMRDPIERHYSAARMKRRDAALPAQIRAQDIAMRSLGQPGTEARGRYDLTLGAIDAAFAPEDVHVGFFETLFTQPSADAICAHLGLSSHPADLNDVRNASPREGEFSADERARLRAHFAPVYAYCRARFGEALPPAWDQP